MTLTFSSAAHTQIGRELTTGDSIYEPEIASLLTALLERGKSVENIFIDVGSNIGYFPLLASDYAKKNNISLQCYAHEPLPELSKAAELLKIENGLDYISSAVALSDFEGKSDFFVSARSDASNSLVKGFRKEKDVITVDVSTLDLHYAPLLDKRKFGQIIIMIDVETAEPQVLRGGESLIQSHRPLVICEVLAGRTEDALQDLFEKYQYISFRYNGNSWVREQKIFGDSSYKFRDWLFAPIEKGTDIEACVAAI